MTIEVSKVTNNEMTDKEHLSQAQEKDKIAKVAREAGRNLRSSKVAMHERVALFSAGTLSLMFTFVGVALGLQGKLLATSGTWQCF